MTFPPDQTIPSRVPVHSRGPFQNLHSCSVMQQQQQQQQQGDYMALTLTQIALQCIALRLQRIACPHETPLRVLCYRLGRARGGLQDGGQTYFPLVAFPMMRPQLSATHKLCTFQCDRVQKCSCCIPSRYSSIAVGCILTVMETKLRPRCHLWSNLRAREGWVGNNMRVGYVDRGHLS